MTAVDASGLTLQAAARMLRDSVKDKSYRAFPLGQEAGRYLRSKGKSLTPTSYRDYESCLDKLARYFMDLELRDLEPPIGTDRLEEFLDAHWGARAGRTYNKNLSILRSFCEWAALAGRLHGDPTRPIARARKRGVYRTTFSVDQLHAIIAKQPELRDRIALRLLLHYGIRKGALRQVQFGHFDHLRRRITVFEKRGKVRNLPIPQRSFWLDLERLILDTEAQPGHYLLQRCKAIPYKGSTRIHSFPEKPKGEHGLHDWWYDRLVHAGLVPAGTTRGERMHKARHTAGQRVLDETGNLKATQRLLGHDSIQTTGDLYTDWDIDQLADTLRTVLGDDEEAWAE